MKTRTTALVIVVCTCFTSGCISTAIMKSAERINSVPDNKSLVNFVRPRVFGGDGVAHDLWDSERFIGSLAAGKIVQYIAEPGEHVFLVRPPGGRWGNTTISLQAGKEYYVKINMVPFGPTLFGVADADDPRIAEWNSGLEATKLDTSKPTKLPTELVEQAERELARARGEQ